MHNVTLAPSHLNTKNLSTPRSKERKYIRILRKIHQMRFQLIQKLKNSKVLFEIIDVNFQERAEKHAIIAMNKLCKSQYKTMKMYDILRPVTSDLYDEAGFQSSPMSPRDLGNVEPVSNRVKPR